jgi:xylan 1,4-beta-xylosidase
MPEALSTKPQPYRHDWMPGMDYGRIYTGWTYPPKDYAKWGELVYQWVKHSVERYGRTEVESWYWEVWNEPDIGYWRGTPEEFRKLHDYAADGLKRALPTARIGGPHVTGPNGQRTQQLMRDFIEHCLRGTNHATGKTGSSLDFVAFHAKGAPRVVDGHVRMGISNQLRAIDNGFRIAASFPELAGKPIIIGESDPEGCAACSVKTNPENAYRNGTMYSSYTAAQIARTYELADLHKVNLIGSVTWAFEFEGQDYFAGFRDLATNGLDKPVLNVFRMLGMMSGERVRVRSDSAAPLQEIRDKGVRGRRDIYALAARGTRDVTVLVWNYHDDDLPAPPAQVQLTVTGLTNGASTVTQYRVDGEHANSYAAWLKMGSPQSPTAAQYKELEQASKLAPVGTPRRVRIQEGSLTESFPLPAQGVSLLVIRR